MNAELIQCAVALETGVPPSLMLSKSRRPEVVRARDEAIYRCYTQMGHITLARLGEEFGGMHHTSVRAAIARAWARLQKGGAGAVSVCHDGSDGV